MKNFVRLAAIVMLALGVTGCQAFISGSSPSLKNAGIPKEFNAGGITVSIDYRLSRSLLEWGNKPEQRREKLAELLRQRGFVVVESKDKAQYVLEVAETYHDAVDFPEALSAVIGIFTLTVIPMIFHDERRFSWTVSQNGSAISEVRSDTMLWEAGGLLAWLAKPGEIRRYNRAVVAPHESILAELIDQGLFE